LSAHAGELGAGDDRGGNGGGIGDGELGSDSGGLGGCGAHDLKLGSAPTAVAARWQSR